MLFQIGKELLHQLLSFTVPLMVWMDNKILNVKIHRSIPHNPCHSNDVFTVYHHSRIKRVTYRFFGHDKFNSHPTDLHKLTYSS